MTQAFLPRLWEAFGRALGRMVRMGLLGLVIGFVGVEILAAIFNRAAGDPAGLTLTWPPVISFAPMTFFVHAMAVFVALLLAYLFAFTVAVSEVFRGLVYAVEHVDDAVASVATGGLNMADAFVDSVDGPNRHGFLGKRGPDAQRQPTTTP